MLSDFSEWGAMLLQQEVLTIMRGFEEALLDSDVSVRPLFSSLLWCTTLLVLDQPADVRRYRIPAAALDETAARAVMARRVDFSREAVGKVKITVTTGD